RIEILSSAGSAIYGANATGGVINIITRHEYRGGQLSVSYGTPWGVLSPRRSASLFYGAPLEWGLNLRLSGHYSDVEPLVAADRADVTIGRYRRLAMERDPAVLIAPVAGSDYFTSTVPPLGARPNIRANSNT